MTFLAIFKKLQLKNGIKYSKIDKLWNVGGPLMWGALGPGLLSRLIQLLFFIFIVRFCSNSWTWEGHILGLFNFDLLNFLIENDFDYTVFKIDMVQVSGITRMLGF